MTLTLSVVIGFCLDLLLGDPRWLPHPVVAMGNAITWVEPRLRSLFAHTSAGARRAGMVLAVGLPVCAGVMTWIVLALAGLVHPVLRFAAETWLCYQLLATGELRRQSMAVLGALEERGLPAARERLRMIVGRDVDALDEAGVIRAAVETVAENASDGVVAPLLYLLVGGAPLGMAYKAVNTLDSMVGYKNERYIDFGRASARLDDMVNFIPARITGVALVAASCVADCDMRGALRIWRRDHACHASPNAGQTEAAMAGALGVRLAGPASYFGHKVEKPFIGDDVRPVEGGDIARANRLMFVAVALVLVIGALCRMGVVTLMGGVM